MSRYWHVCQSAEKRHGGEGWGLHVEVDERLNAIFLASAEVRRNSKHHPGTQRCWRAKCLL